MKVIVSGGTGFVGTYLTRALLQRGDSVVIVSRNPEKSARRTNRQFPGIPAGIVSEKLSFTGWDERSLATAVSSADAIVNLAGSNLFEKRWNDKVRQEIISSRVDATASIVQAIQSAERKPEVFVSASAVGYYGNRGEEKLTEQSTPGRDFLAEVCKVWEEEAEKCAGSGVRLVIPRIGIVQQTDNGALQKMLLPFRLGIGGPLGNGRQYYPWIHMDDTVGLLLFALDRKDISGALNVVAPDPSTMRDFATALGMVMKRPSFFEVPEFALRIAVGESASAIVASHRVIPQKALDAGYEFRFPDVRRALSNILRPIG